jgi:hypothetical protein
MKKKAILFIVVIAVFTCSAVLFRAHQANAQGGLGGNGSCGPLTNWICGLNGINYNNKIYVKGN